MPDLKRVLSGIVLIVCVLPRFGASAAQTNDAARLITRLEKIKPGMYFDLHGNAHEHLQALMVERFRVTEVITRSIDRFERDGGRPELVGALYHVLGFVKDPASIDWLSGRVAGASASDPFYARWLPRWQDATDGYGTWEWLEGRERWIDFFIGTFEREANKARRVELLKGTCRFRRPVSLELLQETTRKASRPARASAGGGLRTRPRRRYERRARGDRY